MTRAIQNAKAIGKSYAKSHPIGDDADKCRHHFFMSLSAQLYPTNTRRRGWFYDNLVLSFENEKGYQDIVRSVYGVKSAHVCKQDEIALEHGWDGRVSNRKLWWQEQSPMEARLKLQELSLINP